MLKTVVATVDAAILVAVVATVHASSVHTTPSADDWILSVAPTPKAFNMCLNDKFNCETPIVLNAGVTSLVTPGETVCQLDFISFATLPAFAETETLQLFVAPVPSCCSDQHIGKVISANDSEKGKAKAGHFVVN